MPSARPKTILVTVTGRQFDYTTQAVEMRVTPGDKLRWKVTVDGKPAQARVDFNKRQGTPLTGKKTKVDVPSSAVSGPVVVDTQTGSFPYTVTVLPDGPSNDPTIRVDPPPGSGGWCVDCCIDVTPDFEVQCSQSRPAYAGDYIRWILNAPFDKLNFRVLAAPRGRSLFVASRRRMRSVVKAGVTRVVQLGGEGNYDYILELVDLDRRVDGTLIVNPAPPSLEGQPAASRMARRR